MAGMSPQLIRGFARELYWTWRIDRNKEAIERHLKRHRNAEAIRQEMRNLHKEYTDGQGIERCADEERSSACNARTMDSNM